MNILNLKQPAGQSTIEYLQVFGRKPYATTMSLVYTISKECLSKPEPVDLTERSKLLG